MMSAAFAVALALINVDTGYRLTVRTESNDMRKNINLGQGATRHSSAVHSDEDR
jgi:hypothetical protein